MSIVVFCWILNSRGTATVAGITLHWTSKSRLAPAKCLLPASSWAFEKPCTSLGETRSTKTTRTLTNFEIEWPLLCEPGEVPLSELHRHTFEC